jgi:hypothetical protein
LMVTFTRSKRTSAMPPTAKAKISLPCFSNNLARFQTTRPTLLTLRHADLQSQWTKERSLLKCLALVMILWLLSKSSVC